MSIRAGGLTDIGTRKTVNQDSYFYKITKVRGEYFGIFAVADGVSGLPMGEHASKIAIQGVENWWKYQMPETYGKIENMIKSLIHRFEKINYDITLHSLKHGCNMATTLSVLLLYKEMYYVVHIGDSRIYRINKQIDQLTVDHLAKDEKRNKMALAEYLGNKRNQFDYYLNSGELKTNEYFIMGSDGIFNRLKHNDMQKTVDDLSAKSISMTEGCVEMINKVKARGETDNITVIIINADKRAG